MKWHRPLFRLELAHVNKSQSISLDSRVYIKTFVNLSKDGLLLMQVFYCQGRNLVILQRKKGVDVVFVCCPYLKVKRLYGANIHLNKLAIAV
jgi:hypothetical protein